MYLLYLDKYPYEIGRCYWSHQITNEKAKAWGLSMRSARLRLGKEVNGLSEDLHPWETNLPSLEPSIEPMQMQLFASKSFMMFWYYSQKSPKGTRTWHQWSLLQVNLYIRLIVFKFCCASLSLGEPMSPQRSILHVPDLKSERLGKGPRKMRSDYIAKNSDLYLLGTTVVGQEILSDSIFHLKLCSYTLSKSLESRIWCIQWNK